MLRLKVKHVIAFFLLLLSPLSFAKESSLLFAYHSTQPFIQPIDISEQVAKRFSFQNGTITFRVKSVGKPNNIIVSSMLGFANPKTDHTYANFYLSRSQDTDRFGIEIRDDELGYLVPNESLAINLPYAEAFRTISYVFHPHTVEIYVDGEKQKVVHNADFLEKISSFSSVYLGKTNRHSLSPWRFVGDYYALEIDNRALSEKEIIRKQASIRQAHERSLKVDFYKQEIFGAEKSASQILFTSGQKKAKNYRIPSLITTKSGVLIAAVDKRNQHSSDWGNIDTVIRRSLDGGKTWLDDQTVIDLASQPYGTENAAFVMDSVLLQDRYSGRIFMFVDMFPEMKGFFSLAKKGAVSGSGHKRVNGKDYLLLTDEENREFTVREQGIVFDENNLPTDYHIIIKGNPALNFKDLGDLYHRTERLGNVFLNSRKNRHDSAHFRVPLTNYLWLSYSDDDGQTWSSPVDITAQVKADWMRFLGTGPGRGVQLKNGNLVVPIYYTNQQNKQAAAVIISTDHGKTWQRSESPLDQALANTGGSQGFNDSKEELTESQLVELDNGELKLFSRSRKGNVQISTSKDGGFHWEKPVTDKVLIDPYAQMSVLKYSKAIDQKEYVLFSNPHSINSSRVNGKIWLGEVQQNGEIVWVSNTTVQTGNFAYSCLTELPNGDIGLLYEEDTQSIKYMQLNLAEFFWQKPVAKARR